MRILLTLLMAASMLIFAQSADAQHRSTANETRSKDAQTVMRTELAFEKQSESRGADAWYDFAADDVTELSVGAHTRQELRAAMTKLYAQPGFKLRWQPKDVKVVGGLGIVNGEYQSLSASGPAQHGTYVTIWQRQKDGSWKFVFDGGTPSQ